MRVWFFIVLGAVLAVAVLLAILMAYNGRSANGQNTTIIERPPSSRDEKTTVIESR